MADGNGFQFATPHDTRHSSKPDALYETIERAFPEYFGPEAEESPQALELFARNYRPKWDGQGFEYPGRAHHDSNKGPELTNSHIVVRDSLHECGDQDADADAAFQLCALSRESAREMVERYHYSRAMPNNIQISLGTTAMDAVACYGPITCRRGPEGWLELRRLVRRPGSRIILSSFLAATQRELKARGVPALISFADPGESHHGGIYQATNWLCVESRKGGARRFITEDGTSIHARTAYARFGTSSYKRILEMNQGWKALKQQPKHRYVMPLSISKAEALEMLKAKQIPYPKPSGVQSRVDPIASVSVPTLTETQRLLNKFAEGILAESVRKIVVSGEHYSADIDSFLRSPNAARFVVGPIRA